MGLLLTAGCGGSGGGDGGGGSGSSDPVDVAVDTGPEGQNIALTNGVPTTVTKQFDYDAAADGPFEGMSVDFSDPATLTALSAVMHLNGVFPRGQEVAAEVTFYVGPPGLITNQTECTLGESYGPFTISVSGGSISLITPSSMAGIWCDRGYYQHGHADHLCRIHAAGRPPSSASTACL